MDRLCARLTLILKLILKYVFEGVYSILLSYVRSVAGSCEHDNKLPSTKQDWCFLDQLGDYKIALVKDPVRTAQ